MDFSMLTEFLSPVAGHETYDYMLYGLFVMGMLMLAFMGSGNSQMDTIFATVSVFLVVLDKLYITGFIIMPEGVPEGAELSMEQRIDVHIDHFVTYAMRIMIFILPLVVAGNTRNNRTRVLAGLYSIFGALYSFGRWWFEIRANADDGENFGMIVGPDGAMLAGGLVLLVVGDMLLQRWNDWCMNRHTDLETLTEDHIELSA